ncbi:MAG: tetratricopeptide repeat protein [Pseudomonadota bacterium]|nr:tetratricopeptide repeat protein [Pseudomonadota bacterium]
MAYQDQEQVDALKGWWQENRGHILTAVVLVAVIYAGFSFWKSSQQSAQLAAAQSYQAYTDAIEDADKQAALNTLLADHADSSYALFAGLDAAEQQVEAGDYETAKAQIQQVVEAQSGLFEPQLQLQLAALQWQTGEVEQAQALLQSVDGVYQAAALEMLGDIAAENNEWPQAAAYYEQAKSHQSNALNSVALNQKLEYANAQ